MVWKITETQDSGDPTVVVLLFYVHGKHLRSCRDGQLKEILQGYTITFKGDPTGVHYNFLLLLFKQRL